MTAGTAARECWDGYLAVVGGQAEVEGRQNSLGS